MIALLFAATLAFAQPAAQVQTLADFEAGLPPELQTIGGEASIVSDRPAQGKQCLRISPDKTAPGSTILRFKLPDDVDLANVSSFGAQMRSPASNAPIKGRWLAADATGKTLFRRSFSLDAADEWRALSEPLDCWIWSGERCAAWGEVASLALVIDSAGAVVFLDDIELRVAATTRPASETIVSLAFPRDRALWEQGGLVVATDVDSIRPEDLRPLVDDMQRARAMFNACSATRSGPSASRRSRICSSSATMHPAASSFRASGGSGGRRSRRRALPGIPFSPSRPPPGIQNRELAGRSSCTNRFTRWWRMICV